MKYLVTLLIMVLVLAGCAQATPDSAEVARLVAEGVKATVAAWPTYTPYPTMEPLPTYTPLAPLPTGTPRPTYTPLPTHTVPPTDSPTPTATETSLPTETPTPASTPTPTDSPTPRPVSDLTAQQVMDAYNERTSLQAKAYMDGLVGTRVRWTGEVLSVSDTGRTGVSITSNKGGVFDARLIFAYFPLDVAEAIKLSEDQVVAFEADIVSWEAMVTDLRVFLDNARLVE